MGNIPINLINDYGYCVLSRASFAADALRPNTHHDPPYNSVYSFFMASASQTIPT